MAEKRVSARNMSKVMDEATRNRRTDRAIQILELDNYHKEPHADLVMSKKLPKFAETIVVKGKRRKVEKEPYKQKFRKNFEAVLEAELMTSKKGTANYISAAVPPSKYPEPHFCSVCGFPSSYVCTRCGIRFCSIKCKGVHEDTRCMKWTA